MAAKTGNPLAQPLTGAAYNCSSYVALNFQDGSGKSGESASVRSDLWAGGAAWSGNFDALVQRGVFVEGDAMNPISWKRGDVVKWKGHIAIVARDGEDSVSQYGTAANRLVAWRQLRNAANASEITKIVQDWSEANGEDYDFQSVREPVNEVKAAWISTNGGIGPFKVYRIAPDYQNLYTGAELNARQGKGVDLKPQGSPDDDKRPKK